MSSVDLSGRLALITGASRGIGAAVAAAYAGAGAHVILLARTTGALEALDDSIRNAGGTATLMPVDLSDLDPLDHLGPALAERFGKLDIFVGNAGMLGTLCPLSHGDAKEWQRVMDVNVGANFRLIRTLDPLLQASDAGRVIFTGSGLYDSPRSYWHAYATSKAALHMMAMTYAAENDKTSVNVNIIHPGPVETRMLGSAFPGGYKGDDLKKPEDIAPLYLALTDPACEKHGEAVVP